MLTKLKIQPTQDNETSVPTLRSTSAEYAALVDRRDTLKTRREEIAGRLNDLTSQIYLVSQGRPDPTDHSRTDRIRALALGGDVSAAWAPPSTVKGLRDLQFEAAQELAELDDALRLLESEISRARMAASAVIREKIRPNHKRLVASICEALVDLHKASAAYYDFAEACSSQEIAWSELEPMFLRFIGDTRRPDGRVADYLQRAARHGFIFDSAIPKDLRQ